MSVSKTCVSSERKRQHSHIRCLWHIGLEVFGAMQCLCLRRGEWNCQSFQEQMMASLQFQFFQHCLFIVDKVFASTSETSAAASSFFKNVKRFLKRRNLFIVYLFICIYLLKLDIWIAHYWMHCYQNHKYISTSNDVSSFNFVLIQIQLLYEHKLNILNKGVSEKKGIN